jgi:uncharacterized iron-regulated protein
MLVVLPAILLLLSAPLEAAYAATDEQIPLRFQEGQVLAAKTGRPIALDEFLANLATQEVIYIGEEHRNRSHIEVALQILEGLVARQRPPILALEMFSWDGQPGLDRYLSNPAMAHLEFLRESRWAENWGGAFEDYEPLIALAMNHHLPVLALNPPRPLVRLVATKGLAPALNDPEMSRWGMQGESFPEDAAYHEMIVKPLRQCHAGLTDQDYQRMYDASVFREEGMAKTIAARLRVPGQAPGPIVSYTGGGHVQFRLPIPNRVLRRSARPVQQTTIYLSAFDPARSDEIAEYLRERIADYVWLTAPGAQGMPRRCK